MLWLCMVVAAMVSSDNNGAVSVELRFTSRDFIIESAQVMIMDSESLGPPGDRVVFSDGQTLALPSADLGAVHFHLGNGRVQHVPFSRCGRFTAILMDLAVRRLTDQQQFVVRQFSVEDFAITETDLRNGAAEVKVESSGIFRVAVSDDRGRPLPETTVSLSRARPEKSGRIRLLQVRTDKSGEIFMLGRPEDFHISAVAGGKQVSLRVDPL